MNALLPMLLAIAVPAAEDRKFDAEAHARAVAPFVEGRTFGVVRVDLTRLDADALSKSATPIVGSDQAAHMREGIARIAGISKQGATDLYVVFSLADIPNAPFVVLPAKGDDVKKLADGQAMYTCACNEQGTILDDLIVYRRAKEQLPIPK